MAYSNTVDERYGGGWLSLSVDSYDASNLLNSTFVLAEGQIGYGNLTDAYFSADKDVYSLGNLASGYYSLDVDDVTWDGGNLESGSVSTFSLLSSSGVALETNYGTYSDLDFAVISADTYYVQIVGPSFGSAQYSVEYEKTGELAVANLAAIFSNALVTGEHVIGQTLTASISYFDANGVTGATPTIYWYADSDALGYGSSNTYTLTESEAGKVIWAAVSFNDDLGNFEASGIFGGTTVAAANSAAIFSSPTYSGSLIEDTEVFTSITYDDSDGNTDNIVLTGWYLDDGDLSNGIDTYLPDYTSYDGKLTLQSSWIGKTLYFTKGFIDDAGNSESSWDGTSVTGIYRVGEITAANSPSAGAVTITGTAAEGETLTVVPSALSDADGLGSFSYQWLRDGVEITSGEGSTSNPDMTGYTLISADVGSQISVRVSYTDGGGASESVTSAATTAVLNVNDAPAGAVTITGTAAEGETLAAVTSNISDVDGLGEFSYQWFAGNDAITNAIGSTLTLSQAEVSKAITVKVSYTDGYGASEELTSSASDTVANVNDLPTGSVTISGTATEGEALAAVTSNISDADDLGAFSYQWLRDGTDISGATASTYTLAQADVGAAISIRASYTDGGGTAESVTSAATQTIISSAPTVAPFDIVLVSETGGVATFEIYADASVDPENDGFGSFEFTMSHDPADILIDAATIAPPQGFIGVPNYDASTGGLDLGGITILNFTDLSSPIVTFDATILDTNNPIDITITNARVDGVLQSSVSETFDFTSVDVTSTVVNIDGGQLSGVTVSYDFETPSGDQKTSELAVQSASGVSQAMARGSDATVTADKTIDTSSEDAIGAYDALQALRLAVGLDKSDCTSEWYDYIAADINKDGRVGADDALNILKFAVGLTDGPSIDWVFVDAYAIDWFAIDRSTTTYNEGIQLSDIMVDSSVDMTGILVGDVDGSYIV